MKNVEIEYISRVEGKGCLELAITGEGEVREVKLRIFESPRFFEALMVGRSFEEAMEIASRICGICPIAHQISALRAVEKAIGLEAPRSVKLLRRLLAIAGHISSHALNIYLLALPDILGFKDAISMAKAYPGEVKKAFKIKEAGDVMAEIIGGRSVHPVSAVLGGFTRAPAEDKMRALKPKILTAKSYALESAELFHASKLPDIEIESEHIALSHEREYAINEGRVKSTEGLDIDEEEFRRFIEESQVEHSTAKHPKVKGRSSYMTGPLARVNMNMHQLSDDAREVLERSGFKFPCFNPFAAHVAKLAEIVSELDESLRLIDIYDENMPFKVDYALKEGSGAAITEAPRGMNYHFYRINKMGIITQAEISPPTCQNAKRIEDDIRIFAPKLAELSEEDIAFKCAMLIRAYDPCISCATHSLKVKVKKV